MRESTTSILATWSGGRIGNDKRTSVQPLPIKWSTGELSPSRKLTVASSAPWLDERLALLAPVENDFWIVRHPTRSWLEFVARGLMYLSESMTVHDLCRLGTVRRSTRGSIDHLGRLAEKLRTDAAKGELNTKRMEDTKEWG